MASMVARALFSFWQGVRMGGEVRARFGFIATTRGMSYRIIRIIGQSEWMANNFVYSNRIKIGGIKGQDLNQSTVQCPVLCKQRLAV